MPNNNVHVGPFSAIYVGLASGQDTAVLTQLTGLTTGPHRISIDIPETFNYYVQNSLQSGPISLTANITFLSDDPQAWVLAYGNFLNAPFEDSSSQFVELMVLLIHPDSTSPSSFLIPTCYARKTIPTEWSKSTPTTIPLVLTWQDISRFNNIYYKRTPDQLAAILGSRSPI